MKTLNQLVIAAFLLLVGYVLWQWAQNSPGNASGDASVTRSAPIVGQTVNVGNQSPTAAAPTMPPAPVRTVSDAGRGKGFVVVEDEPAYATFPFARSIGGYNVALPYFHIPARHFERL